MKRILLTVITLGSSLLSLSAQGNVQEATASALAALMQTPAEEKVEKKPQYWTNSAKFNIGFDQTSMWNWAAGGYNTLKLYTDVDAHADYSKDLSSWNNRLQLQYGFLWSADKMNLMQKNTDNIYLESKFAHRTKKDSKWNYSASFSFRSQFTDSYDSYKQDEVTGKWSGKLKSGFLSPAYSIVAFGIEWKPSNWFNVNLAPVTGGFTICTEDELKKKYGMKLRQDGLDPSIGANYRSALFQFGAEMKVNLKASINDAFNYETQLVLFTDYLNKPFQNNRVNWDNSINWQLARFINVSFKTWMIYDPIVLIDGDQKIQFKEFFSINFTYTFTNKR